MNVATQQKGERVVASPDATTALCYALRQSIPAPVTFEELRSRRWQSATFSGARHHFTFRTEGTAAADFLAEMDVAALPMCGHLLADIALLNSRRDGAEALVTIEALTVED